LTLDLRLSEERGLDLLADIRIQRASHAAPVIGVTMPAATDVGATFSIANLQCKPIRSDEIQAAMSCFRLLQPGCASMLVIDDDPLALDVMRATLKRHRHRCGVRAERARRLAQHRPVALRCHQSRFDRCLCSTAFRCWTRCSGWSPGAT
jgi:ActR/RegA family two-component response regulator